MGRRNCIYYISIDLYPPPGWNSLYSHWLQSNQSPLKKKKLIAWAPVQPWGSITPNERWENGNVISGSVTIPHGFLLTEQSHEPDRLWLILTEINLSIWRWRRGLVVVRLWHSGAARYNCNAFCHVWDLGIQCFVLSEQEIGSQMLSLPSSVDQLWL